MFRRRPGRPSHDDAHILVLEAVMVAALLLGIAAYMALTPLPGQSDDVLNAQTSQLARDTLQVLSVRPASSAEYESALHEYVTEAILGDSTDLVHYMDRTLPESADWGIYLDNGEDLEVIHETGTPTGEVVSDNIVFYPDWNYALAFATMDKQPGAAVTSVCTPLPIVVCTPTGSAVGSMKIKIVPVQHSYLDRDVAGKSALFDNGRSFPLTQGSDHILTTASVSPEAPTALNGFDTPYDLSSAAAYTASITAYATSPAKVYGVNSTLDYDIQTLSVYRVHPTYVVDATLQTFLDAQPRVTTASDKQKPGDSATITYDFAGLPLKAGWSVSSREIYVYGPVLGHLVDSDTLPGLSGTWDWEIPRNALYGTYTFEVRLNLVGGGGLVQTVHDVTAFDVLRRGVDEPVPPVYRAVVAVWFNSA